MKFLPKWGLSLFFLLLATFAFSQKAANDSSAVKTDTLETEEVNVVDIIIQRGLMAGTNNVGDLTSLKNSSGTWFVGLGFKIPVLKNKAGFRLTPGIAWTKLNYDSVDVAKTFPDLPDGVDYNFQKHRLAYFQVPLGAYMNFSVDPKGRALIFGEAGGFVGYRIGGVLRYGENSVRDQVIRTKISNIPDMKNLQYGLYGRVGYKNVALNVQYRITDLFEKYKTDVEGNDTGILNPIFPQLEFGLTILL
jgi:hypothetical protein